MFCPHLFRHSVQHGEGEANTATPKIFEAPPVSCPFIVCAATSDYR